MILAPNLCPSLPVEAEFEGSFLSFNESFFLYHFKKKKKKLPYLDQKKYSQIIPEEAGFEGSDVCKTLFRASSTISRSKSLTICSVWELLEELLEFVSHWQGMELSRWILEGSACSPLSLACSFAAWNKNKDYKLHKEIFINHWFQILHHFIVKWWIFSLFSPFFLNNCNFAYWKVTKIALIQKWELCYGS